MPTEIIILSPKKVILDVILLMCVAFPILFLFLWGQPYERGFFCNDQDLIHPYHPSTIPSIYLTIIGISLNCVVMILIEYLNQPHNKREVTFLGYNIPTWTYNVYYVLLLFGFGMSVTHLTTDIMKYTIGRLRPHFLTVCRPNINCTDPKNQNIYYIDFTCLNPVYNNDKRIMKEMRLSFPSGHSSFAMFTMLYFAIYLQKRMDWNGSKLLRHTLQFLAILSAIFTGMTRISDHKHHWSDVLAGLAIGTIGACVTATCFSTLFEKTPPDMVKCEVSELQQLNGNRQTV